MTHVPQFQTESEWCVGWGFQVLFDDQKQHNLEHIQRLIDMMLF